MSRIANPMPADRATSPQRRSRNRRTAIRVGAVMMLLGGIAGLYGSRMGAAEISLQDRFYAQTARLGLRITDVALEGRQFTSRADVMTALNARQGAPILAFDPGAARAALESLPRVASAEVERRLPDTVNVRITERAPVAIWQCNGKMVLIDRDGVVLGSDALASYTALPMVVGEDAAKPASDILDIVATESALAKRVTAYIRVGGRRWDLRLDNNVEVKLPEHDQDAAVHRLAAMEARNGLLERDVLAVDLRLPGKLIVETSQVRDPKHKPSPQQGI